MKKRWLVAVVAGLLAQWAISAHGFETFVVRDIRVEGLKRISEGTVLNYLPIHVGEELPESRSAQVIKALFETGFFQDIQLTRDGNILVIKVTERPTIGKVTLSGNKDIKSDNLLSTLKSSGLAEGYVFDRSTLEQVRNELERLYFSHGKYAVKVDSKIENQANNRVNIAINIDEGQAARIKTINIVGNKEFSKDELLDSFTLTTTNLISWMTRSDQYDKQKLSANLEALRTFYLDRGYLNFRIISTQVSITPDKQDIYITVNIEEGHRFKLSSFGVAGDTILPPDEYKKLIDLREGEVFSRAKVADAVKAITDRLGQEGYAFAKINPVPDIQDAQRRVALTFYVEPGSKIYVRRILFEGNAKTKDEVLRREMIQMESAPVNTKNIEDSRARLNRTGYFTDVKVDMRPVAGTTDEVDLVYVVEEASAGQIGGGVGYSDVDGLLFNINVTNRNFLGTGKNVDFNFNRSKAYTTYSLAYNDPYYTLDGISRGFNIFYSETDLGNATSLANYTTDAYGANVVYSLPLSPVDKLTYGYGAQSTHLSVAKQNLSLQIEDFLLQHGPNSDEVTVAVGWVHNSFDRFIFPENGVQQGAGITATVPGSHLEYYRITYNAQWYRSIGHGFILMGAGTLGYGNGYAKTNDLPFYKNFYCGGIRTVRGFDENSLGPKDSLGNPFGGDFLMAGTAGVVLPTLFGMEKSVRISLFVDAGQAYDLQNKQNPAYPNQSVNQPGVRFATGISLTWMSPMAPLNFSLAKPLNPQSGDQIKVFAFNFGTAF